MKNDLTAECLREMLDYDRDTGIFNWRVSPSRNVKAGARAGTNKGSWGYVEIRVKGRIYGAHRLAILHVTGEWPTELVDHRNGVRTDNRYANLRCCTNAQNVQNSCVKSSSATGVKGVGRMDGKYRAEIKANKKRYWLGDFETLEEAKRAYNAAASTLHGEFARLNP